MLAHAVVAFIDFLGFRAMVQHDAKLSDPIFLPKILESLDAVEGQIRNQDMEMLQFSDSIVLTSKFTPSDTSALLQAVAELQRSLVERHIAIRGGIAFGRHYAQGGRLFSMALVNAYELESSRARFPRVLVDHNLLDWCMNHVDLDADLRAILGEQLMHDRDGEVFVAYLRDEDLPGHATFVKAMLAAGEAGNTSVLTKAHWLVDYHEHVASAAGQHRLEPDASARFRKFG